VRERFLQGGPAEELRDGDAHNSNGAAAAALGGSSTRERGNREQGRVGGQAHGGAHVVAGHARASAVHGSTIRRPAMHGVHVAVEP